MRHTIGIACLLVVAAVSLVVAQPPAPKPVVDQATIDAVKKRLEQKEAEIKEAQENLDRLKQSVAPPATDLEAAQYLFGVLFACFGNPKDCFIALTTEDKSDDPVAVQRFTEMEASQNALNQLTNEVGQIRTWLHAAGVVLPGDSILNYTVLQPDDKQKALEDQAKADLQKSLENKNQKKDEPPPPPPPPPISSTATPPTWDLASAIVLNPAGSTTMNLTFDLGRSQFFTPTSINALQLAAVTSAVALSARQRQGATTEESVIEVPAATQPVVIGPGSAPLKIVLTSLGRSSGEAMRMLMINQSDQPVTLTGDGIVVEPVGRVTGPTVSEELKQYEHAGKTTVTLNAYCLDRLKEPPAVGTELRLVPDGLDVLRPILAASRALQRAGRLQPDLGDEKTYVDAIRQWAIWSQQEKFDERRFTDAFVQHAKKNVEASGQRWDKDTEKAFRDLAPGRWRAVQMVLRQALSRGPVAP